METNIIRLDERTDPATKQMLQNVIERKRKFDKAKKSHFYVLWTTIFTAFFYLYFVYVSILEPYSFSFSAMFSKFISSSLHVYLSLTIVGLFGATKLKFQKKEKAEKEYQALRGEIIDRSKDLWKEDAWRNRHQIFEMMKSDYDINLYHESK